MTSGIPIEPRILSILAQSGEWMNRIELATALGRRYGKNKTFQLGPSDIAAAQRLEEKGLIQSRRVMLIAAKKHIEYKITYSGIAMWKLMQMAEQS